jgi:phage terminase large subunit-like protein
MLFEKAVEYANDVVSGKEINNKYVKRQCEWFLADLENQHAAEFEFYFDHKALAKIEGIFKLLNFATGLGVVGQSVLENLWGFQAFFLSNVFGWRFKNDSARFRYRDVTMFICRKNGKTWMVALLLICLMLTEDPYSEFYSISKDRELAAEIKKAINQVLTASPHINKYFTIPKTLSGKVVCKITNSYYQPRTADAAANNGIRSSAFVADETGAFKDWDNINALRSGQLSVRNPLRFNLTTAYAEDMSIMLEELAYIKKVFDGLIEDKRMFALLYFAEPDHLWDDIGLHQSNPLRIPENYTEIKDNRAKAIESPSQREEFLTKHCNHFLPTNSGEEYINVDDLRKCKIDSFDWSGRSVWIGVDLAQTTDNCAVAMCCEEDLKIYADVWAFVPTDRVAEKNRVEKINYHDFIKEGKCFACGDLVVDYSVIEDLVLSLESKFGVTVMGVGYDRFNALSSAQKFEKFGLKTVEVKQHASVLHTATKLLREKVLMKEFFYTPNTLFEINVQNAKVVENNNKDIYINKKKSTGKVDMLAAMINSVWMLQQDVIFNPEGDWAIQVL